MIEYLDQPRQGLYNQLAPKDCSMQLSPLTLEKNSVLVVRVQKDSGYDMETLTHLRNSLQQIFPCHSVFIWYDDIDFMAIADKGVPVERIDQLNDTSNYY